MIHVGFEPVFIDADGDEVTVYNDGPGDISLSVARDSTSIQTISAGSFATLRQSRWASSIVGATLRTDYTDAPSPLVVDSGSAPITATTYSNGQLTSLTQAGVTTTYTYNADGTLATAAANGKTTTFFWNADGSLDHTTVA